METIKVYVGSVVAMNGGVQQDTRRAVEFEGEELGRLTVYGEDPRRGTITDTRGTTQTLYKTADGRLVVHVDEWSRWQGEPNTETLVEVTEDLGPDGEHWQLGEKAGFGRPMTLDEVLNA